MIDHIDISNFRSLSNLREDLERVTTFVGRSAAGKSNTLRALRWLFTNRPQGDAFIRHGTERCRVAAEVDGRLLVRRRGPDKNSYRLDRQTFTAFGTEVPEDIKRLVNISELNIQRQHDASYWFSLSPPQLSRELNKVIALDLIDTTLGRLATEARAAKATLTAAEERLREAGQRQQRLAWVPELANRVEKVEGLAQSLKTLEGTWAKLAQLVEVGEHSAEREIVAQKRVNALERATEAGRAWLEQADQYNSLSQLVDSRKEAQEILDSCIQDEAFEQLEQRYREYEVIRSRWDRLTDIVVRREAAEEALCQAEDNERQAAELLRAEFGTTCPTCLQPLPSRS